jgi:hypothetical protein
LILHKNQSRYCIKFEDDERIQVNSSKPGTSFTPKIVQAGVCKILQSKNCQVLQLTISSHKQQNTRKMNHLSTKELQKELQQQESTNKAVQNQWILLVQQKQQHEQKFAQEKREAWFQQQENARLRQVLQYEKEALQKQLQEKQQEIEAWKERVPKEENEHQEAIQVLGKLLQEYEQDLKKLPLIICRLERHINDVKQELERRQEQQPTSMEHVRFAAMNKNRLSEAACSNRRGARSATKVDSEYILSTKRTPSGIFHDTNGNAFDALLHFGESGHDNYYVLQVIENEEKYIFFSRWGRMGARGQFQIQGPFNEPDLAVRAFEANFNDLSGQAWTTVVKGMFLRQKGKYDYIFPIE